VRRKETEDLRRHRRVTERYGRNVPELIESYWDDQFLGTAVVDGEVLSLQPLGISATDELRADLRQFSYRDWCIK
jgi:hypothetical protein